MSMAPPPLPTGSGHRSTTSAPISGLPNPSGHDTVRAFGTPSRPAPAPTSRPGTPHSYATPQPYNNTTHPKHASSPSASHTTTTSHKRSALPISHHPPTPNRSTPFGQHTRPHDPTMSAASAASSVSAASAAVDSPYARPTAAHLTDSPHKYVRPSRTEDSPYTRPSAIRGERGETRSGFSDPSFGSRIEEPVKRAQQSAPTTPATRHRVSRSVGCYPISPVVEARRAGLESPSQTKVVEPNLPTAATLWTPSELAQYLSWALRTGGSDGQGPTLPSPVVEDVVSWVLRARVTGRQFVLGVDQGVARPPPFLPVLAALSRRLRRRSRLSGFSDAPTDSDAGETDGDQVTRVRRLAHAFDVISSASEVSENEGPSLSTLREQLTGDSVHGFGRATPKTEQRLWSRRDSVASIASGISAVSGTSSVGTRWRPSDSGNTAMWATQVAEETYAAANASPTAPLRAKAEARAALELAELANLSKASPQEAQEEAHSPPPPYATSDSVMSSHATLLLPTHLSATPSPGTPMGGRSGTVTPARPASSSPEPASDASNEASPSPSDPNHQTRMGAHRAAGVDPYAALRRSASRGASRPSALLFTQPKYGNGNDSDEENKPPGASHWSSTRRVTAKPLAPLNPITLSPAKERTPSKTDSSGHRRRREVAMAREVASLHDRIRELEDRLAVVETPSASVVLGQSNGGNEAVKVEVDEEEEATDEGEEAGEGEGEDKTEKRLVIRPKGWLGYLGLADTDGTEPRLQDLPAVLFLLGVGVGVGFSAVVMRLLLNRKIH